MCFLSIFFAVSIQRQQTITNEMSGFTSKNYPARKNFEMFTLDIGNNMKIECMSAAWNIFIPYSTKKNPEYRRQGLLGASRSLNCIQAPF